LATYSAKADTSSDADQADAELQDIVQDLQEAIRQHRETLSKPGTLGSASALSQIHRLRWVNSHLPIGWPVMPKGIVPKLIAYAQKITRRLLRWYINPIVDQQNAFNAAVADALENLQGQMNEYGSAVIGRQHSDMREAFEARHEYLAAEQEFLTVRLAQIEKHIEPSQQILESELAQMRQMLEDKHREAATAQDVMHRQIETLEGQIKPSQQGLEEQIRQIRQLMDSTHRQFVHERETARLRLQRLENWHRRGAVSTVIEPTSASSTPTAEVDYFLLGAQYRNTGQMASRFEDYDDLFVRLLEGQRTGLSPRAPVLDIGAGRGDLVEHLNTLGLQAYGVDIDHDAVAMAQEVGRDVRREDAYAHLQALEAGSLAAIVLIQVIEHLSTQDIIRLLELIHSKLMPGGFIVAETINPVCLWALTNWYLLDPSHRTPLHPEMARFLFGQVGFGHCDIRMLHPVADEDRLELLSTDGLAPELGPIIENLQRNTRRVNEFLYGSQDYCIIAFKPEG
jgi:O-antigen chain-terminating methyltransferase